MARYGGPMASSRTALSQLVSPDRRLAWSLTAVARRREWERARVLRSWQAAQRAQQRTARRSARAAPRSAVLGATFLAMAVPAGGSTREVCAGLGAFFGTRAVVALASLRSARQRAGGPPVPAAINPLLGDLEEGVAAFEQLLAAAAELASANVGGAAATDGVGPATQRLREATDSLAGLAHGLRTVAAAETTAGLRPGN